MRITSLLVLTLSFLVPAFGSPSDPNAPVQASLDLLSSDPSAVRIRYNLEELQAEAVDVEGTTHTAFQMPGEGVLLRQGMPALPAVTRNVVVDPQANLELVVTEETTPRRVRSLAPPLRVDIPELVSTPRYTDTTGLYPPSVAEMSEPFIVRGVRMVSVTVYPIQYDFATHSYIHHSQVTTEVRAIGGIGANPVQSPIRRGRSREFLTMIRDFAINGDEVGRDDPDRDAMPAHNGHYLVVVHERLLQHIVPFIEWRRKAGYKMDIYSVRSQDASSDGTIRNEINRRYQAYIQAGQDPFEYLLTVGDRSSYGEMGAADVALEAPQGAGTYGARHGDWIYACVEGNDERPDIGFGRWPGGTAARLGLMVGRTLRYEATPNMDDTTWFTRGGALSQHWGNSPNYAYHVTIPLEVRWGAELLKAKGYTEVRFQESIEYDQYGERTGPVFQDLLNDGANMVLARSENYYWCTRYNRHNFNNDIEDNTVFPIRLNASGHGEWSAEMEYRTGDANHLKGWVSLTNSWNGPVTGISNAIWVDQVHGICQLDLPMGWGYAYAIAHFETHLPRYDANGIQVGRTDHNHFGDPGLKVWTAVPRVVQMDAPESISPAARLVETIVHEPDGGAPIANALVTFYAPGQMPAADNAAYATYARYWRYNTTTDENGVARLVLQDTDTLVAGTNLYATVTGVNVKPFFAEISIENQEALLEISSYGLTEIQGNGDDQLNPGELFSLNLNAKNLGAEAASGVQTTVSTLSPYVEIDAENGIEFGDIASGEEAAGNRAVIFTLSPFCPDGAARPLVRPTLLVEFTSQDQTCRSAIKLDPYAPHLEFTSVVGGDVIPDSGTTINVEVTNLGRINSGNIGVELKSLGQGVTVVGGRSTFPPISPGNSARLDGNEFELSGNKVVVPGSRTKVYMVFNTESGFVDTSYFTLQVMRPRAGAPIGPDKYGYICFDDTDTLWDVAPEYQWEEINPNGEDPAFDGTRLNFRGQSPLDMGEAIVVPLGFTTQFYGRDYDTITVSTNGFVSVGNQPLMVNHHNWELDQGIGGGAGMIAPFWDDLRLNNNSGIYVYADTSDSRFIVEWYRMRPATGDADQTFQLIIYDKNVWITETGDPNIEFRYKTIRNLSNIRNSDAEWVSNNPYASVGISSPEGDAGINYTWNNAYPPGAAPLENRRAILFSTAPRFRAGKLYGQVWDVATGLGVEGATVFTKHGFVATTDQDGFWSIAEALAEVPFEITARKQGYNDSNYVDQQVIEHDSLEINFGLLHPEFTPTTYELGWMLDPGLVTELGFTLTNTGNGPMNWTAEKRLLGDANAAPWEHRRTYDVGQTVNDDRIEGVVFANEHFYCSGAAGADSSTIYVLDRDGNQVNSFPQPTHTRYGMKDLEWDGENLWGSGDSIVSCFTAQGEVINQWRGPFNPTNNIAYDSDEGLLWLAGTTTNIAAYDLVGNAADRVLARKGLRIYGLAYWPEDPQGYNLYIFTTPSQGVQKVYKMDTATGDTLLANRFPDNGLAAPAGAFICNTFDVYSWVLMGMQNIARDNGGDLLKIWQLDARKDWMNLDHWGGELQTWESQDFTLTLNSTGLPDTLFQGEMLFRHNADSGRAHIMISLRVIGEMAPNPFALIAPENGDTLVALPLHGDTLNVPEVVFAWNKARDPNFDDTLFSYIQWFQVGDQTVSFPVSDTFSVVNLDTIGLPIWFDRPVTWWVRAVSGRDTVECVQRYMLSILPNAFTDPGLSPVEFGLKSAFPSPFNSVSTLRFGADRQVHTTLSAYDVLGRRVAVLFDQTPRVGYYNVVWDAGDLASGVYMLRLESAGRTSLTKVALIR